MSDIGTYVLHYRITEKGTGSCTASPIIRKLTLQVTKRPPQINYDIPDYPNLRAAVPFEIKFPEAPCVDTLGHPINYYLLDNNEMSLPNYITLDMPNNRIHGLVPNNAAGAFF